MQKKISKKKTKNVKSVKPRNISLATGVAAATGLTTTIGCIIQINSLKKENKKLKSLLENKNTSSSPTVSPDYVQLKNENKKLMVKVNQLQEELMKKNHKNETNMEKIKNIFAPVKNDTQTIEKLQKEIENLKLKCKELKKPITEKIKETLVGPSDDSEKLKKEIRTLLEKLEQEKNSKRSLVEENRNLMSQLDRANRVYSEGDHPRELEKENNELRKQNSILQNKLNSAMGVGDDNIQEFAKIRNELEKCKKEFEDYKKSTTITRTFTGKKSSLAK